MPHYRTKYVLSLHCLKKMFICISQNIYRTLITGHEKKKEHLGTELIHGMQKKFQV